MSTSKAVTIVILVVLLIIFGPVITIWSVNTMFQIGWKYSFSTWLATLWLFLVFYIITNKK